jgi:hypothetical protein
VSHTRFAVARFEITERPLLDPSKTLSTRG